MRLLETRRSLLHQQSDSACEDLILEANSSRTIAVYLGGSAWTQPPYQTSLAHHQQENVQ